MATAGIRELRDHLSRYLERVQGGEELTVTDRGRPVARLVPLSQPVILDQLIAEGVVEAAGRQRSRPARRVSPDAPVSDLVAEQRR